MNTHTPELISASLDHPSVETDVWGPGWKGWSRELSISENLARRRIRPTGLGVMRRSDVLEGDEEGTEGKESEMGGGVERVTTSSTHEAGCGFYDLVWTISDIFRVGDPLVDNPGCGTLFAQ